MRKTILSSIVIIIGIIIFLLAYLSIYGIKTEKFNKIITDRINQIDPKLSLEVNEVFLKLNLQKQSIKIDTQNAKIYANKEFLNLSKITANLNIIKFLKKDSSITNISILTKSNKIKNVTNFLNSYSFSLPRLIIYNQIRNGIIQANININFSEHDKGDFTFSINGKINDANISILNKVNIENINFDFNIKDKQYYFNNINFKNDDLNFTSDKIVIKKIEEKYKVNGNLLSKRGEITSNYFFKLINKNLDIIDNKKIEASTENKFEFIINPNKKIKDLKLNTQIKFEKIFTNEKYQKLIFLNNGIINSKYTDNEHKINIDSGYSFINGDYENSKKDTIKINIIKIKNKDYKVELLVENNNNKINSKELLNFFKFDKNLFNDQEIVFGSSNRIVFDLNKQNKVINLKIKSQINLEKFLFKYKSPKLKNILNNFKGIIKSKDNVLDIDYKNNKLNLSLKGKYTIDKEYDIFNVKVEKNKKNLIFNSNIKLTNNKIVLKNINYKKEIDVDSEIEFKGEYINNEKIKFKNITYSENKNKILISNLYLSKNYKILDIKNVKLIYQNENQKLNNLNISKKNNKLKLVSDSFDGKSILENIIKGNSNNSLLNNFKNLSTEIILNFDNLLLNEKDYLNKVSGSLLIEKNKIKFGNISAKLNNMNDLTININTNSKKEKITKIFIEKPEPFIENYKFIKGFNGGYLSLKSIEKGGLSRSNLKISDFKILEVPVLAKILTLASLQGIADLLTGEGIRFNEFEMDYESTKTFTKINEMYAIGPAISILMEGFIEKEKLISLRGTLVPATTINKFIGKIKILGNILVGKKKGEGVFGVSFKIKGPPKKLKTTVNPVKTLTPRFITRTLDKLKKN